MKNHVKEEYRQEALKEFRDFRLMLERESPRGKVILAISYLDELLVKILEAALMECQSTKKLLNGSMAPIGSFVARLHLARALGVLTDRAFFDLNTMAKIRNSFAHDLRVTFSTIAVVDRINSFRYKTDSQEYRGKCPEELFILTAASYMGSLSKRQYTLLSRRLTISTWKN